MIPFLLGRVLVRDRTRELLGLEELLDLLLEGLDFGEGELGEDATEEEDDEEDEDDEDGVGEGDLEGSRVSSWVGVFGLQVWWFPRRAKTLSTSTPRIASKGKSSRTATIGWTLLPWRWI